MEKEIESKLIGIILTVFDLSYEAVFSRCRKRELVICRQTIHTICMEKLKYSDSKAGQITGHDRCTAINSHKSINNILDVDFKPYASYIKVANGLCKNALKKLKDLEKEKKTIDFDLLEAAPKMLELLKAWAEYIEKHGIHKFQFGAYQMLNRSNEIISSLK